MKRDDSNLQCGIKTLVALLAVSLLGACGGSGGDDGVAPDPIADLGGWWRVDLREASTAVPFRDTFRIQMRQDGLSVLFHGHAGVRSPGRVTWAIPSDAAADRQMWDLDVLGADRLEGEIDVFLGGLLVSSLDARLTRTAAPTGAFTARGLVNLSEYSLDSTTAYARDVSLATSYVFEVRDSRPDGEAVLRIGLASSDAGWQPASGVVYDVGVTPGLTTTIEFEGPWGALTAKSGAVTFTWLASGRLAGSYTAAFDARGSLTGLFDCDTTLGE